MAIQICIFIKLDINKNVKSIYRSKSLENNINQDFDIIKKFMSHLNEIRINNNKIYQKNKNEIKDLTMYIGTVINEDLANLYFLTIIANEYSKKGLKSNIFLNFVKFNELSKYNPLDLNNFEDLQDGARYHFKKSIKSAETSIKLSSKKIKDLTIRESIFFNIYFNMNSFLYNLAEDYLNSLLDIN